MTNEEIAERVQDIIAKKLGVNRAQVTPTADFIVDLNADSLDVVELVIAIERDFDLSIPDEEAENIRTVQDAINYIQQHKDA